MVEITFTKDMSIQYVHVDSRSSDNKSIIDIKNVGNENANTSS